MNNRLSLAAPAAFRVRMAIACLAFAHGLPFERTRAGEPDDVILRECFQVCDPAALHYSAGPDVARAGGHS